MLTLLALVIVRHIPFTSSKDGYPKLQPVTSTLLQMDRVLEDIIKRLEVLKVNKPPNQENLIIMVNDSIELIEAVSSYNLQILSFISKGKIKESYHSSFIGSIVQNLEFEKVRIKSHLDRIESLSPLISNKDASDAMDKARQAAQSIFRAVEDAVDILRE